MGASPRWHRRSPRSWRVAAIAVISGSVACGACGTDEPARATTATVAADGWPSANSDELDRLEGAIDRIVSALEGNDVRLLGDAPADCADAADGLAASAIDAGASIDGERLEEVAALCGWLTGPAAAHDVRGVQQTLDPLLVAVGRLAPVLGWSDSLS